MPATLTITRKVVKKDYFKTVTQANSVSQQTSTRIHREMANIASESSHAVTITFNESFQSTPIGVNNLKVYRMTSVEGAWGMQDVLFTFPSEEWLTKDGFSLNVNPLEELTGIRIEYNFTE